MSVLIVGFVLLLLLLASVVFAASALYLERKKLLSAADGAALAAADTYLATDIQGTNAPMASLTNDRVQSAAVSFLVDTDAYQEHEQLQLGPGTGSAPGGTAVVVLSAVARPPLISFLLPEGVVIEVRSTARSRLTQ
ncbi:pilus assembly protein TadG-related protein [Paenarthrobacter sp. NPDC089322]|uniref:pilus assembly protein TadG-related protein n=1 Tax=Paenarthrobacter sp. NPDC089322 TaxID=3155065 RepID=UPI00343542A5